MHDPNATDPRNGSMNGILEQSYPSEQSCTARARRQLPDVAAMTPPQDAEMPQPPDANALVAAIAERSDKAAFTALFEIFAPRVKSFMMRRGLPAQAAEDIAQETMLAVWRKAASFSSERGNAAAWIFTIARNAAINRQRRERETRMPEVRGVEEADPAASIETVMISTEQAASLRQALAMLSPEQNLIVKLAFFQDQPHSDLAQQLGIPLGTVKSRIRLAIARLRLLLDDLV